MKTLEQLKDEVVRIRGAMVTTDESESSRTWRVVLFEDKTEDGEIAWFACTGYVRWSLSGGEIRISQPTSAGMPDAADALESLAEKLRDVALKRESYAREALRAAEELSKTVGAK